MNRAINIGNSIIESLSKHEIIKDVFHKTASEVTAANFKLSGNLIIEYPFPDVTVAMGNKLSTKHTQVFPKVFYSANEDTPLDITQSYTLILTDPDAPSRTDKKWSEFCHFVETGIKFKDANGGMITSNNANVIQPYVGPGPPKGTGNHRYIWLLYKEPKGKTSFTPIKDRPNWGYGSPATGVNKWATENNLELLSVNFFFAEHE